MAIGQHQGQDLGLEIRPNRQDFSACDPINKSDSKPFYIHGSNS